MVAIDRTKELNPLRSRFDDEIPKGFILYRTNIFES